MRLHDQILISCLSELIADLDELVCRAPTISTETDMCHASDALGRDGHRHQPDLFAIELCTWKMYRLGQTLQPRCTHQRSLLLLALQCSRLASLLGKSNGLLALAWIEYIHLSHERCAGARTFSWRSPCSSRRSMITQQELEPRSLSVVYLPGSKCCMPNSCSPVSQIIATESYGEHD